MLENLKPLKNDMELKDWTISCFIFHYKKINYIVLVKRFLEDKPKKNPYALVMLQFMREDDLSNELECEANSIKLFIDAKSLRTYFGIEYGENLGDILSQFTAYLGQFIPQKMPDSNTKTEKIAMVKSLSESDREDPRKVYCTHVRRNPKGWKRSKYNADKTKILRRKLFDYFEDDQNISFCYSISSEDEKDDSEIMKNFALSKQDH